MIRRPPRSTLFPTRRSSDLDEREERAVLVARRAAGGEPPAGLVADAAAHLGHEARFADAGVRAHDHDLDRKSTRLNSSHVEISYAVFCLKKKKQPKHANTNE